MHDRPFLRKQLTAENHYLFLQKNLNHRCLAGLMIYEIIGHVSPNKRV